MLSYSTIKKLSKFITSANPLGDYIQNLPDYERTYSIILRSIEDETPLYLMKTSYNVYPIKLSTIIDSDSNTPTLSRFLKKAYKNVTYYQNLREVSFRLKDSDGRLRFYVSQGIIMDEHFKLLVLVTVNANEKYITIYLSPRLFGRTDLISKGLIKSFMEYISKGYNEYIYNEKYNIRLTFSSELDKFIVYNQFKVLEHDDINDDIHKMLNLNINDIIKDFCVNI